MAANTIPHHRKAAFRPRLHGALRLVMLCVLAGAVIQAAFLAWISRDMPYLGNIHDDSVYWVTAKSLAAGGGYHIPSLPGRPFQTKYPPLYPLLLSMVWRVWPQYPENLALAMILNFAIMLALIALLRRFFDDCGLQPPAALLLCAIFALSPFVNMVMLSMMSDLLFLLLLIGSLLLAEKASRAPQLLLVLVAAVLASLAFLTRAACLPLVVTTPLVFALRRQFRQAALFAGCLIPAMVIWTVWSKLHLRPGSDFVSLYYEDYATYYLRFFSLRDIPALAEVNAFRLWNGYAGLLGVAFSPWLALALGWAAVLGTVHVVRDGRCWHYAAFGIGYLGLLLFWVVPGSERFIIVVFPLLLLGFWRVLAAAMQLAMRLFKSSDTWKAFPAFGIVFAMLALMGLWVIGTGAGFNMLRGRPSTTRARLSDAVLAYAWISQHTSPADIAVARRDCVLYLYTGRTSFFPFPSPRQYYWPGPHPLANYSSLADVARTHRTRYLLISEPDLDGDPNMMAVNRQNLANTSVYRKLYSNGSATVYEILAWQAPSALPITRAKSAPASSISVPILER